MDRITSIAQVVVPFRAPEIHNDIINFPAETYFYFDQDWDVVKRFEVFDNFKDTFKDWSGLDFKNYHFYPVNGSTEAITQCILDISHRKKKIALVKNEYRWYPYISTQHGITIQWIKKIDDLTQDCVYITSLPFCKDGKFHQIQKDLLEKCEKDNIECWLDCAYFGSGKPINFEIPKTATNVFFSFSKNYALHLNRLGVWLSKKDIPDKTLLNKVGYFPLGNMALATMLMKKYPKDYLWNNYRNLQLEITDDPTDIVFISKDKCISGLMMEKVKSKYTNNSMGELHE